MFEKFTDRTRRVVVLGQEAARASGSVQIDTEHFLLGLIKERDGLAAKALENLGISLELVQADVGADDGRDHEASAGHIPFSANAKQVLQRSLREMEVFGDSLVGTEHLLLALVSVGQGVAAQTLVRHGLDHHVVREEVLRLRLGRSDPKAPG